MSLRILFILLMTTWSSLCFADNSSPNSSGADQVFARKETLVIGRVSDNPKKHYKRLRGMVDYAVSRLAGQGISKAKILFAKDNQQMVQYLKTGEVDWISESVFSALRFIDLANAKPWLLRWKNNVPKYRSVFFVRKDSGINGFEGLAGKKIAFNDAGSTTSFLLPAAVLKKMRVELVPLKTPNAQVPENKVGYFFTGGGEVNVSTAVYTGRAQAGAISNQDWESEDDMPGPLKKKMQIIYESEFIPRRLEIFREGLGDKLRQELMEILLTAHENPVGRKALLAYDSTNRFEKLTTTTWKSLEKAKSLLQFIVPELESH